MLFSYRLIDHGFTKLHGFVEYLVLEVWTKAQSPYSLNKISLEYRNMVSNQSQIATPIQSIYDLCLNLTPEQKRQIVEIFSANNDLEGICEKRVSPFRYATLESISPALRAEVEDFCKKLYTNYCKLVYVRDAFGSLDDYFDAFVTENKQGKCPFCGLNDLKSAEQTVRDAFDHFLGKDRYPFNSVNPANLAPACHTCNSLYKTQKDPVLDEDGQPRKAYYPFAEHHNGINIKVKILKFDPTDWSRYKIQLDCDDVEEIKTWRALYSIDEQYNAKCSGEGKQWLEMLHEYIYDMRLDENIPLEDCFEKYVRPMRKRPFVDSNFLRVPFFEDALSKGYLR